MRVPQRYVPSFVALRDLPSAAFDSIVNALDAAPPTISVPGLAESVADASALNLEDIEDLIQALASLTGFRRVQGLSPQEVSNAVAESDEMATPKAAQAALSERLLRASETRAVRLLGKAVDLGSEHDKVFVDARVLTDLRPIFSDDADDGPEGALLSHTLKFEFVHDEGRLGNFYVVLDEDDLAALVGTLERARRKAAALKRTLENAGLTYMAMGG